MSGNGIRIRSRLLCPRCGTNLEYMAEAENVGNGSRTITYFYRCPRCGYRLDDELLVVKKNAASIMVKVVKRRIGFEQTIMGLRPLLEIRLK